VPACVGGRASAPGRRWEPMSLGQLPLVSGGGAFGVPPLPGIFVQ
jgi:hypothetical protein